MNKILNKYAEFRRKNTEYFNEKYKLKFIHSLNKFEKEELYDKQEILNMFLAGAINIKILDFYVSPINLLIEKFSPVEFLDALLNPEKPIKTFKILDKEIDLEFIIKNCNYDFCKTELLQIIKKYNLMEENVGDEDDDLYLKFFIEIDTKRLLPIFIEDFKECFSFEGCEDIYHKETCFLLENNVSTDILKCLEANYSFVLFSEDISYCEKCSSVLLAKSYYDYEYEILFDTETYCLNCLNEPLKEQQLLFLLEVLKLENTHYKNNLYSFNLSWLIDLNFEKYQKYELEESLEKFLMSNHCIIEVENQYFIKKLED